MPPVEDTETPPASAPPAPVTPLPPARAAYQSTADVFDRLAGAVFLLTPAQAAEAGEAVRPLAPGDPAFALWGREPILLQ